MKPKEFSTMVCQEGVNVLRMLLEYWGHCLPPEFSHTGIEIAGSWRQDASANNLSDIGRTGRNNASVEIIIYRK